MNTTGKRIRVVRLIEYSYDSAETMAEDMKRWTLQQSGSGRYGPRDGRVQFRSVTLPPEMFDAAPAGEGEQT